MSEFLPPVVAVLLGNITDFSAKMDEAEAKAAGTDSKLTAAGKASNKMFLGVGAAVAGVAVASVKMASDFETQMTRLYTAAGAPKKAVEDATSQVLALGNEVGFSGTAMAEALYHPVSAGLDLATSLKVVQYAAEEAQISGASLDDTTYSLSSVMKAFNLPASQAHDTMAELNAIVGEGDMRFQDFNGSIKNWAPTAAQMGISIDSMGAALAYLTDRGNSAEEAATRVTMGLSMMATPSKQAAKLLEGMGVASGDVSAATTSMTTILQKTGITQNQLAQDLKSPDGIYVALTHLKTALNDAGVSGTEADSVLAKIFGGGRSDKAIMSLLQNLDGLKTKFGDIQGAAGQFDQAWGDTQKTFSFQMRQLGASAENLGISIGMKLIPIIQSVVGWFERNQWAVHLLADVIEGVLIAAMLRFAQIGISAVVKTVSNVIGAFGSMGAAAKGAATETEEAAAKTDAAAASTGGFASTVGKSLPVIGALVPLIGSLVDGVVSLGKKLDGTNSAWDGLNTDKVTNQLLDMAGGSRKAAIEIDVMTSSFANLQRRSGMTIQGFKDLDSSMANLVTSGNASKAATDFDMITQALGKQGFSAQQVKDMFPSYEKALEDAATQNRLNASAAKNAGDAVGGMQTPLAGTTQAANDTTTAIDAVTQAFNTLSGNISSSSALDGFKKDLLDVTTNIQQNGKSLGDNTLSGLANRDAFRQAAKQILDYRDAQIKNNVSTDVANATASQQAQQLITVWEQLGANKQQVEQYATSLGLIPADLKTQVTLDTTSAYQQINGLASAFNRLSTGVQRGGQIKAYAQGGWVDAPKGQPMLAVVHGGEFVLSDDMLNGSGGAPGLGPIGPAGGIGGPNITNVTIIPQGHVLTATDLRDMVLELFQQRGIRNGSASTFPSFRL